MEPISIIALALYGAYQASQRKKSSSSSTNSSYSASSYTPTYAPPQKLSSISQSDIKKAPETRMCQPEIKLSDKNKIKSNL